MREPVKPEFKMVSRSIASFPALSMAPLKRVSRLREGAEFYVFRRQKRH